MIDVVFVFATLDPVQHCMIFSPNKKNISFLVWQMLRSWVKCTATLYALRICS